MVDNQRLESRATSLELSFDAPLFISTLASVASTLYGVEVVGSLAEFEETIGIAAQDAAADDDKIGSRMAETNCTGPLIPYLEPSKPLEEPLPNSGDEMSLQFEGNVQGDHDNERPFSGDPVDVTVEVRLPMLGRRLTAASVFKILDAQVDWS